MKPKNSNFNQFFNFINFYKSNRFQFDPSLAEVSSNSIGLYKKGNKIKFVMDFLKEKYPNLYDGKAVRQFIT